MWAAVEKSGSRVVSTVTFIVLARHVAPTDFGLVALSASLISIVGILQEQGYFVAIVQRPYVTRTYINTAFWAAAAISISLAVVLATLAVPLGSSFDEQGLIPVLRVQSLALIFSGLGTIPAALLHRSLRFTSMAARKLMGSVAGGVTGIAMAFAGKGVWALVVQGIVDAGVCTFVMWLAVDWFPRFEFSRAEWRELRSFGIKMVGVDLLTVATRRLDDLLIGTFLGAAALGYYAVAYRFILALTDLLVGTINAVAVPVLSRLQDDARRARSAMQAGSRAICLLVFPTFFGLSAVSPDVIQVMFGSEWTTSALVMRVLALSGAVYALYALNTPLLAAHGRPSCVLKIMIVSAMIYGAGFFAALRWGIIGVATAFVVSGCLVLPISTVITRRLLPYNDAVFYRGLFPIFLSAVVSSLLIPLATTSMLSEFPAILRLSSSVAAGVFSYILLLRLLAPLAIVEVLGYLRLLRQPWKGASA
jgi:PST family polysaccharide transporter